MDGQGVQMVSQRVKGAGRRGEEALGSLPAPSRGALSSACRVKMRPFLVPPRPLLSIGSPADSGADSLEGHKSPRGWG